jgi:hypothetical protein
MSTISRRIGRAATIGLLFGVAPVASAIGQENGHAAGTAPQQLIQQAASGQPVGQPASMVEAPATLPDLAISSMQQLRDAAAQIEEDARQAAALEERAEALRPGQFVWQPERAESGEVELVVSIEEQKAYVYRANRLVGVTTVSTGARGHRTPTGSFTILQKNRRHFSNLYNNAPMPNMQRLTWDGIALHAGALPGYPASHGCVRLPMEFSRLLFGVTRLGGRVHIVAGSPPSAAQALAFATDTRGGRTHVASAR